ncbi:MULTISPECIES: diacylglycerol kinase family protein [unclassified Sphingomonas]|uniref:diacylglycerol/lipid kinase family protein n=1 Tax=Novosphingobium rhizosphaerae TaxID=1551649 RepID=UPI0015CEE910
MTTIPLWLVVNPASGSNSEAAVAALTAALAEGGHAPTRVLRLPADELPTRAALEAANVATLAIFTGDGTVNAQVALLHGWEGAVLVLPGGTQNLLAKALHGDADAPAIAARLGRGELRRTRRSAVKTSAGDALVEVLAGPGATWADVREGVRDMDLSSIASALGEAVRSTAGGAAVSVSEPPLGKPEGYRAVRMDADDGTLTLDGYDAQDWADLAAHGVSMLVKRDFRQGPHEELGQADAVVCTSREPIALMIDGERRDGATQEEFRCITLPVEFLASAVAPS